MSRVTEREYEVLLNPARGCRLGSKLFFGNGELKAEVAKIENGRRFLRFGCNGSFGGLLDRYGQVPLPPYIKRDPVSHDRTRYQTVYAEKRGAIAAPTAGLHFTKNILSRISGKDVDIRYITLHVGYGTFRSVKYKDITRHRMEKEYFEVQQDVLEKVKSGRSRTIAVGTTTCRALESLCHCEATKWPKQSQKKDCFASLAMTRGWTDLFIYPPYNFKAVDALLTNFHLPRTTLLMLVSAFCGRELLFKAYREAIKQRYRFYSYGDAMLIL